MHIDRSRTPNFKHQTRDSHTHRQTERKKEIDQSEIYREGVLFRLSPKIAAPLAEKPRAFSDFSSPPAFLVFFHAVSKSEAQFFFLPRFFLLSILSTYIFTTTNINPSVQLDRSSIGIGHLN